MNCLLFSSKSHRLLRTSIAIKFTLEASIVADIAIADTLTRCVLYNLECQARRNIIAIRRRSVFHSYGAGNMWQSSAWCIR